MFATKNRLGLAALCLVFLAAAPPTVAQPPAPAKAAPSATDKANARKWVLLGLEQDKNAESDDKRGRLLDAARVFSRLGDQAGAVAYVKEAEALIPPPGPGYGRGIVSIVSTYFNIGEWDKALAFAKTKGADNAQTYAAIGEAQAKAKDTGAKATLLIAQTKLAEEEEIFEQVDILHQIAGGYVALGAMKEAGDTLVLAQTALDKETNINLGIPKLEREIMQARLLHKAGKTAEAQTLMAQVEKDTLASPYVYNEQGLVLYKAAVAAQDMGKPDRAKALADKAAPLIVKIESEGNEARTLRATLMQQALAGQVTAAVTRAKKGEYRMEPLSLLMEMAETLGEEKHTADAKVVFAEALALNAAVPVPGDRLYNDLRMAPAMADAGDKAGADALFADAAKRIPLVPEEKYQKGFWTLWVMKRAASDLTAASAHINDSLPELRGEMYLALANAASQGK